MTKSMAIVGGLLGAMGLLLMLEYTKASFWVGIAAAATAFLLLVIGGFTGTAAFWHARRAWKVWYLLDKYPPPNLPNARYARQWRMEPGVHTLCLRVTPATTVTVGEIQIRFTRRRWPHFFVWTGAPKDKVEVLDIADVDTWHKRLPVQLEAIQDGVGGYEGRYVGGYQKSPPSSIWLYVTVQAKQPWAGRLHFRSALYGRERFARLTCVVANPNMSERRSKHQCLFYGPIRKSVHPDIRRKSDAEGTTKGQATHQEGI